MRRSTHIAVILLIFCVPLVACGGGSGRADTPNAKVANAVSGTTAIDPCEILNADLIGSLFDVGDAALLFRQGSNTTNPSCLATWPVDNVEEVKAEGAKAMQDYMMAKISGEKDLGPMPIPHLDHEVRLTFAGKEFKDAAAAQAGFDGLMVTMKEGVTAEVEHQGVKQKHTFKLGYDHEVDGVGEKAIWATKRKQLSFVTGRHIIHLNVDLDDPAENERLAMQTAQRIIDRLK